MWRPGADRRVAAARRRTPNFKILEHFDDFADAEIKKVVKGAPQVVDGYFQLSHEPGPRVELDTDAAAEFPQQQAHFDLWAEGWEKRNPSGGKANERRGTSRRRRDTAARRRGRPASPSRHAPRSGA
ncbi:Enoyl reductase (ER) domain-containing protein OS=Streptomyces antimycoticus OX=68175 GN=SSPO_067890 PE=3 SV=1 [Streptomyces antimycoticus]